MGCVTWLLLIAGFLFIVMSLIRWFDETAEAVDAGTDAATDEPRKDE